MNGEPDWVEIGKLPPDLTDLIPALEARSAQARARERHEMGLIEVPALPGPLFLWCGHPASATVLNKGVSVCTLCSPA